jgi:serine/threonine protein phosphatase 1
MAERLDRREGSRTESSSNGPLQVRDEIQLGPSVDIEPLDPDRWDDIYIVGDVHGCLAELEVLLDRLAPSDRDVVVFVGDLVRKGPDSEAVLEMVRSRSNLRSVRGNNEQKLLDGTCADSIGGEYLEYLQSLPVAICWDDQLVLHGGIDPRVPLDAQKPETLITMRSIPPGNGYCGPYWFESYEGPPRAFFGHTVLEEPLRMPHAVGLDTGCVYGGALTAYDYHREEFVSVPANHAYQPRPETKIHSSA